ncbi:hypothetical protein D9M68_185230 [compost metagenome]
MVGTSEKVFYIRQFSRRWQRSRKGNIRCLAGRYRSRLVKDNHVGLGELLDDACVLQIKLLPSHDTQDIAHRKGSGQRQGTRTGNDQHRSEYIKSRVGIPKNPVAESGNGNKQQGRREVAADGIGDAPAVQGAFLFKDSVAPQLGKVALGDRAEHFHFYRLPEQSASGVDLVA